MPFIKKLNVSRSSDHMRPILQPALFLLLPLIAVGSGYAQTDPGVRGGLQNTGGGLQQQGIMIPHPPAISANPNGATILPNELALFLEGIKRAGQLESTCDLCSVPPTGVGDGNEVIGLGELDPDFPQAHTNSNGLGTRHNGDSCFVCHAQPTLGGSGGFISLGPGLPAQNPAFDLIPHRFGKKNVVPSFITQFGPIREVRFRSDNGVHQLWVTSGITNDPYNLSCAATQPDFATELANNNLSFRIPLQILGLGLIDSIQDTTILGSFNATAAQRGPLGINGRPNLSGNDGTITRFGWKAQNKSITIFAGEAYNVEMGVSNELLPTSVDEDPLCANSKPEPNDVVRTDPDDSENHAFNNPLHELPDWMNFQVMMRFTDAPAPDPNPSASAQHGATVFNTIGCNLCHTPAMITAPLTSSPVLSNRPVKLFSDLLLHHMGPRLADNVSQGVAGGDEFRSVPLWGVGQRIFFLHDGRTQDIQQAIFDHAAVPGDAVANAGTPDIAAAKFPVSEATAVVQNFRNLSKSDRQSVLDFLRSL